MKTNIIYNKDCLIGIRELPDNSIDLICTDPPYGIKFMGKLWDKAIPSLNIWKECLRVLKPGSFAFVMCIPRQDCLARMIVSLEEAGFVISFTPIFHCFASGFPKAQNIAKFVDKKIGTEKIIGKGKAGKTALGQSSNWHKTYNPHEFNITEPNSPQAQALEGSYAGFQPKPSVEVVIVAMKPLETKTYVDQALKNKKGITWLDEGRIPYESKEDFKNHGWRKENATGKVQVTGGEGWVGGLKNLGDISKSQGRFPANLLCSDDVLNDGKVRNNIRPNQQGKWTRKGTEGGFMEKMSRPRDDIQDSGSFSRYFSLDAWWEKRLKDLPESVRKTFPFLIVPKSSKSEKNKGVEDLYTLKEKVSKKDIDEIKRRLDIS